MEDTIINVNTLPEPICRRIRRNRVLVRENDGEIILTPVMDNDTGFWESLVHLQEIFSDGKISSEKFMKNKQFEKELER